VFTNALGDYLIMLARYLVATFSVSLISLVALVAASANGQTAHATQNPPVVCPPNLPDERTAGELSLLSVTIEVPAGRFAILESPPESGDVLVCYQARSGVRLSGVDCSELDRLIGSTEDSIILDRIASNCRLNNQDSEPTPSNAATSTPAPDATLTTPRTAPIQPPDTGDAGMKTGS
jgi:hypothetical protein